MTVPVGADGAIGLYGAVADAFAGRRLGFGVRRAAVAARFARHRGQDDAAVATAWVAGALAEVGLIAVVVPPGLSAHARLHHFADAPFHGARIVEAFPGLPRAAADLIRWHREHDDGTGIPDRLRWDGIPADAAALGIAHAFLEAIEDPDGPRDPDEALFTISAESGRTFRIELVRAFRAFFAADPTGWDAPLELAVPVLDEDAALVTLAARIDARDSAGDGRSERLAALAGSIAGRLNADAPHAARLARLLALCRAAQTAPHDDFDPLSRFARGRRTAAAERAAAIAAAVPGYAAEAPHLAASAAWFEDGVPDRLAGVLALALAADALGSLEAPRRIAAAAGTQFDPEIARAYLTSVGAAT